MRTFYTGYASSLSEEKTGYAFSLSEEKTMICIYDKTIRTKSSPICEFQDKPLGFKACKLIHLFETQS